MELSALEVGHGDRVAILLHGMMGSSKSWWRVVPALVDRGYRVVAVDLPGHGHSSRDPFLTVERAADAVAETASARGFASPSLAIGHSFGGLVLAAALESLDPAVAVLVDAPTASRGGWALDEVRAEYEHDRAARTVEGLLRTHPHYDERDACVEAEAAALFDPDTAAAVAAAPGGSWPLPAGTIVIRPVPSTYISDQAASTMRANGVIVHDLPGALHSPWYGSFDEFMALIPN